MTVQLAEKSFVLSEQLPFDAGEDPTAIVCAHTELFCTDRQIIGSKALIKGGAQLRIVYESSGSMYPAFTEQCLPFSVLVDLPEGECTPGRVILQPTALYTELGDAINGSRTIELELHAVAQLCFEKRETISYISDAYSTCCPVIAQESVVPLCRLRRDERIHAEKTERIQVEQERGFVAGCGAELLSFGVKDGKALLSVSVSLLLQDSDGSLSALQRTVSVENVLSEAEAEIAGARISSLNAERLGEEIELKISCELDCVCCRIEEIRFLSSLETDEDNAFDLTSLPSLTLVKKAGRDLWNLAKQYHSSVEAIGALGEKYAVPGDLLLIPRI